MSLERIIYLLVGVIVILFLLRFLFGSAHASDRAGFRYAPIELRESGLPRTAPLPAPFWV